MNFAGTSGAPSGFGSVAWSDIGSPAQRGDSVTIADAHLLFSGNYERAGSDLIVSDHLHRVVVSNYFHGDKRPALVSSEGVALDPKVIEALTGHVQYAQAGSTAAAKVIGHVVKMTGSASIVRNGVTIDLNNGDVVYQNDVVQTGSGSTLGLVLIDGTTFNLTANARLMMNDLTYDPTSTSNTSLFTLVQGAANFVAGQVAKTGDMKVSTPVATMGIRGTAVILDISAIDGKVSISVVNQRDGQVHAVEVYNTRGDLIGTVTSNGSILTLTPTATFEVIAQESNKTVAQVLTEFNAFQQLLSTYDIGKQMVPDTPAPTDGRRGDATPQTTTKFAGTQIIPSDSSVTKFNAEIGSLKSADGGVGTGDLATLHTTGDASGGIKVAVTIGDTPLGLVTVAATSIPFVVTPSPVSRISSGPGDHFGPVMSADGQFVTYDPDGAIFLFDRQSGTTKTIASPQDGFTYGSPTISADGRFIVYQGSDGTQSFIYLYNNDASDTAHYGQTTRLMAGGQPAISGDGSRIVIEQGGSIALFDQQGHQLANLTADALGLSGALWKPAISADGHIVAFWSSDQSTPGGAGQLFTYDLSTATFRSIASTATGAGDSAASFSADGHYLVYQSDAPGGHAEIYLTDLRSGQVIFHTANADASYNPVISPDGHFIIFASDARLTGDDSNNFADIFVVDVTDPSRPVYKLVSVLDDGTQGNAASNLGATISAGGQFVAFGSSASNFSTGDTNGAGDIFVVDPSSGHSAIILEGRNSPAVLTASGIIKLTGEHNGVTLGVSDTRITAAFDSDGNIRWSFSEQRSDFAGLQPGEIAVRNFVITLGTDRSTTEIPVKVSIYDVDQTPVPVADAAPVANPVTLAPGTEDAGYTVTSAALLAGVVDIDGPSLSITGLSVSSGGGTIVDNHDGTFRYTPAANYNGPVVFGYTVSDGTLSASSTARLDIAAVNDAPVLTVATFAVSEGGTAVLTSSNIAVSDVDNAAATFAVSGVTHGRFQTTADGTSWADATTFTSADLAASHVRFVHDGSEDAPNFSIQADDGEALNHLSATVAGSVQLIKVNDAPTVTGAVLTISEGGTVVLGAANIGVTDPDNNNFVFTTSNVSHGSFQITTDGTSWVPATTFNTALLNAGHVRFVHDGGEDAPTFSIQADDGAGGLSNVSAAAVNFTNINDAPVAAASGNAASGDEDHTISGSVPAGSDVDDASGLSYALESGPDAAKGALALHSDGTFSFVPAANFNGDASFSYRVVDPHGAQSDPQGFTITVHPVNDAPVAATSGNTASGDEDHTISGSVPAGSDVDDASGLSYALASGPDAAKGALTLHSDGTFSFVPAANFNGDASFSYRVVDPHGAQSDPQGFTITVHPVNDAPVAAASGNTASGDEDHTISGSVPAGSDVDDASGLTYALASGPDAAKGALTLHSDGTFSFVPVANFNGDASFSYRVVDPHGAQSDPQGFTITVHPVNDAPVLTKATFAVSEGGTAVLTAADIGVSDPDSTNFTFSLSGVGHGKFQIMSGGSWADAASFTSGDLAASHVRFVHDGGEDAPTFSIQADDGAGGLSNVFAATGNFTNVNDAPAGSDNTVTTLEDASYTFKTSDFGFSDPNDSSPNSLLAVKIATVPGVAGTLRNNGTLVNAGDFISATDISAGHLVFTPASNANGSSEATFTFQVRDDGGTVNGGVDLDQSPNTLTIDVTPVNDTPVNHVPGAQTVNEDTDLVFTGTNAITISDVDGGSGDETLTLTVSGGTLTLGSTLGLTSFTNNAASVTLTGTVTHINAALDGLTYRGNLNFNGSDTLNIVTHDNGNIGGGDLTDTSNVTINVTAVNDAPAITTAALTISEGETVVLSAADIGISDPDSASFTFTVSNVSHGTFQTMDGGGNWADAASFTSDDLTASHVRFVHDGGEDAPTFSIQADDGAGGLSNVLDGSISFANVNDAPVLTKATFAVSEGGTAVLSAADIGVSDPDSASFTFSLSGVSHGKFQIMNGGSWADGASFTSDDLAASHVRFVHDGGEDAPMFSVQANDGAGGLSNVLAGSISFANVNDAPVLTKATFAVSEGGTAVLTAADIGVSDPDSTNFTFSLSGVSHGKFQIMNGGSWADATTFTSDDLTASHVRFVHDGGEDAPTFSVQADDSAGGLSNVLDGSISFTNVNDAPSIVSQTLASVAEDAGDPAGRSVADIFGASFLDVDHASSLKGIAVIGDDSTAAQGLWQYKSAGGGWEAIGQVDQYNALIFAADTELRFVPAADFNGTPGSLQVVGVDDSYDDDFTTGAAQPGGRYTEDVSVRGGSTPFSDQAVTLGIAVTAVNDAPLATGAATLAPIDEDNTSAPGDTIANLFGTNFSDAADEQTAATDGSHANAFAGIAISDYTPDAAKGDWQYATPGGNWTALGTATASAAITLSADVALRFVPAADYNGSATALAAHLIESGGAAVINGAAIDLAAAGTGGSTHYSAMTVTLGETINPVNDAPVIEGGDSVTLSVPENTTTVETVVAHDVDGQSLTYSILTGGGSPDASKFSIGSTSGALSFTSAPDFGNPTDSNHNNIYTIQVKVSDGTLSDIQTLHVHVTDVNDNAPVITTSSSQSVAENQTLVTQLSAFDVDTVGGPTVFSIADGLDGSLFEIVNGNLQFRNAPDFENPADGNHNNIYSVTVNASDGLNSSNKTLFVQVTNVNEAPLLAPGAAAVTYAENAPSLALMSGGTITDPDNPSNFDDGSLSVTLNGAQPGDELVVASIGGVSLSGSSVKVGSTTVGTVSGNHSTQLTITFNSNATDARVETVLHALAFDSTSDNPGNADRTATVTFNDGSNDGSGPALSDSSTVTIHVTPVNDAPHAVDDVVITNNASNSTYLVPGWALLANDTDPDSAVLGISGVSHPSGFSTTNPLVLTAGGDVTIHDNASVGGSFDYTASDGSSTSTAHVTVTQDSGTMDGNGSGNEIFVGDSSGTTINAKGGDDILIGNGGNDTLNGGPGNDIYVFGLNDGNDLINDASGLDTIRIEANGAALSGLSFAENTTHDLVIQFNGQQITVDDHFVSNGNVGGLKFDGGASYDGFSLGSDPYFLSDASGSTRNGTSGNDILSGDGNANTLSGGDGNDLLFGNAGNDTLNGGSGNDFMRGGSGNDSFVFAEHSGHDTISDFTRGQDKIDLQFDAPFDSGSFASWRSDHGEQIGADTLLHLDVTHGGFGGSDDHDTILLKNTLLINLTAGDFIVHAGGNTT